MTFLKKYQKFILVSLILILFLVVGYVLFVMKIGDLRPVLFPPKKDLVKLIEKQKTSEAVSFPLKLDNQFKIGVFAKNLHSPRDLQFTKSGTLLASIPNLGKVVALVDKDKDGRAEIVQDVLTGLNLVHGLAFNQGKLYVAELTKVTKYSFDENSLAATKEKVLFNLPASSGHVTRTIAIKADGTMYVSLGSTCNVCLEKDPFLAAVIVSNIDGNKPRLFAKGLRNSVFIKLNPKTSELWGTEMGRDLLGDNVPPEEINIIKDGKDYGWPYCFSDKVHDDNFDAEKRMSCSKTIAPIFKMQAHSAPLGLNFINSSQFPDSWQGDLLVSYHGSWNRSVPTGYKIVRLDVEGNKIKGQADFLTGFLQGSSALGRPVDLEFDAAGSLYISDDKIGVIYKVVKK